MTLDITGLRYPDSHMARPADWDELAQNFEDDPEAYTYAEAFDYDDVKRAGAEDDGETGETHTLVYVRGLGPLAIVVDGEAITRSEIADRIAEANVHGEDAETPLEQVSRWARVMDRSWEGTDRAEGPMMSSYWPVRDDATDLDEDDLCRMAAKIAHLPLCVVYVDGTVGLALTGGGMDLSWEIAEAFIRIGYYPPTGLGTLPQMAMEYTDKHRAIVRALTDAQIAESRRLVFAAERNIELYLPDVQATMAARSGGQSPASTPEGA